MKTVHVNASREYDVLIGAGLLGRCGELIAAVTAAVAEELGTDVSALRVRSFRKIG